MSMNPDRVQLIQTVIKLLQFQSHIKIQRQMVVRRHFLHKLLTKRMSVEIIGENKISLD